LPGESE
jgi:hypothetical protein